MRLQILRVLTAVLDALTTWPPEILQQQSARLESASTIQNITNWLHDHDCEMQ